MKRKSLIPVTGLFSLAILLFSFSVPKGGEGFEIYLNSKLIVQQFGAQVYNVKSIQLDQSSLNDELTIKYFHCGQAGKDRSITIKDGQNRVLKVWRFEDGTANKAAMTCKVKDIIGLKKGNETVTLNLYYSSCQLPNGRQLAALIVPSNNKVAKAI